MQQFIRKLLRLAMTTVVTSVFGAASSFAAVIAGTGGPLIRVDTRSDTSLRSTFSDAYINLPGAHVRVTIPAAGGSRLIVARFAAVSRCFGTPSAWCNLQIIAFQEGVGTTVLNPAEETSFDSVTNPGTVEDHYEAHAIERSLRLKPGTYLLRVQWAATEGAGFVLDDWHLTVSQYD